MKLTGIVNILDAEEASSPGLRLDAPLSTFTLRLYGFTVIVTGTAMAWRRL